MLVVVEKMYKILLVCNANMSHPFVEHFRSKTNSCPFRTCLSERICTILTKPELQCNTLYVCTETQLINWDYLISNIDEHDCKKSTILIQQICIRIQGLDRRYCITQHKQLLESLDQPYDMLIHLLHQQ